MIAALVAFLAARLGAGWAWKVAAGAAALAALVAASAGGWAIWLRADLATTRAAKERAEIERDRAAEASRITADTLAAVREGHRLVMDVLARDRDEVQALAGATRNMLGRVNDATTVDPRGCVGPGVRAAARELRAVLGRPDAGRDPARAAGVPGNAAGVPAGPARAR